MKYLNKGWLILLVLLSGCTFDSTFVNTDSGLRHIEVIVKEDVDKFCKSLGVEGGLGEEIYACAEWDRSESTCIIYTKPTTTYSILGHELRHCYQYHFHP